MWNYTKTHLWEAEQWLPSLVVTVNEEGGAQSGQSG